MRRETKPKEVMEVDFGHLGITWNAATRSRRRTWVFFSGLVRHSRRTFCEVVFGQEQETFFARHMHAFERFGGVPEKVTPDNLKARFPDVYVNTFGIGYRRAVGRSAGVRVARPEVTGPQSGRALLRYEAIKRSADSGRRCTYNADYPALCGPTRELSRPRSDRACLRD